MFQKGGIMFTRRYLVILVMLLSLLVLLLPACGGDNNDGETTPAAGQATTTTSASPTIPTTSGEPVKIGVLAAWTGPTAMLGVAFVDPLIKTVEKQLEDMGGILGGRPVEFIKADSGGNLIGLTSAAEKLLTQDDVCVIAIGGASPAEFSAMTEWADENRILYVTPNSIYGMEDHKYTVEAAASMKESLRVVVDFITKIATPRPQTVGVLAYNDTAGRELASRWINGIEDAGIEIVYEQYLDPTTQDLSPYLTKIKHTDPDYLIVNLGNAQYMAMAKQMMELGGWGGIKVLAHGQATSAAKMPGAEGWIIVTSWYPSKDDPASLKFKEDYEAINGKTPTDLHVYFYNCLWTAVQAIELAGTDDREAVATAARSGNLEFDTPMGRAHFDTDGHSGLGNVYVQIQKGGVIVPFP